MKKLLVSFSILMLALVVFGCVSTEERAFINWQKEALKNAGLKEKYIKVDDLKICYFEGGVGETVLLVHGMGRCKEHWTEFAGHLTPYYHVVAIDLVGHGKSEKIPPESYSIESYSIEAQTNRLNDFVEAMKLDKFHIAGNSMGGGIAGKYTVQFPDKVISLCLLDTFGIMSAKESDFIRLAKAGVNIFAVYDEDGCKRLNEHFYSELPKVPENIAKHMCEKEIANNDVTLKVFGNMGMEGYSLERDFKNIGVRTFVIWGDSDRILDVSSVDVIEAGIADCLSVIIKDCGHLPMVEKPEETARYYLEFLQS